MRHGINDQNLRILNLVIQVKELTRNWRKIVQNETLSIFIYKSSSFRVNIL